MREFSINYRKENGLSVLKMAKIIGCGYCCYYEFEKGRTPKRKNYKLFEKFYEEHNKQPEEQELPKAPVKLKRKRVKKQVYNLEDLASLLRDDVTVIDSRGYSYNMLNGFVVKTMAGNPIIFNAPILFQDEKYFYYEEERLSLNVGNKYRGCDGSVVYIFAHDDNGYLGVTEGQVEARIYDVRGRNSENDYLVEEL